MSAWRKSVRVVLDANVVFSGAGWRGEAYACLLAVARRRMTAYATSETLEALRLLVSERGYKNRHSRIMSFRGITKLSIWSRRPRLEKNAAATRKTILILPAHYLAWRNASSRATTTARAEKNFWHRNHHAPRIARTAGPADCVNLCSLHFLRHNEQNLFFARFEKVAKAIEAERVKDHRQCQHAEG